MEQKAKQHLVSPMEQKAKQHLVSPFLRGTEGGSNRGTEGGSNRGTEGVISSSLPLIKGGLGSRQGIAFCLSLS